MTHRSTLVLLLLASASLACGRDPLGPPPDDIIGSWASTGFEFISKEGLGRVDVAARGWSAAVTLDADHSGRMLFTVPDAPGWTWAGPWEIDGDLFRLGGQGADITLKSGALTLRGFDGVYDFDADSEPDPAKFNLVLARAPRR